MEHMYFISETVSPVSREKEMGHYASHTFWSSRQQPLHYLHRNTIKHTINLWSQHTTVVGALSHRKRTSARGVYLILPPLYNLIHFTEESHSADL